MKKIIALCITCLMPTMLLLTNPIVVSGQTDQVTPQPDDSVDVPVVQDADGESTGDTTSEAEIKLQPQQPKFDGPTAKGIVFVDTDSDGKYGENDQIFSGVRVSNGFDIVETDKDGGYEIPVTDDSTIFLIKPNGFRTALNDENLPKFFYTHKPNGSPQLKYPGVAPTGNLPQSIDFPLYEQSEPEAFNIILFGDPQPRNNQEVDFISHDIVNELIGNRNSSAFGVSLGDLAFDSLNTLEPLNQSIALIGIPWYNVIGNHDINTDTKDRKYINETFERIYGPSYYSFDYGQVHFVVLDNIDWVGPNAKRDRYHYEGGFGERQLEFVKKDLELIPDSQMVVLLMHVPITNTKDKNKFFELIEDRPFCVSISGHQHYHEHLFLGKEDGFNGKKEHHHIINVTICGSWWSGAKDYRGIPHTTMADGAPNGYSIMSFSQDGYKLDYKAAGRPASEQMRIRMDNEMTSAKSGEAEVWVNVYNGSIKSTVEMAIDDSGEWVGLEKKVAIDPHYAALTEGEKVYNPPIEPKLAKPKKSSHLWTAKIPANLEPGTHLLRVKTTDMHDRTYYGHRSFRVTN